MVSCQAMAHTESAMTTHAMSYWSPNWPSKGYLSPRSNSPEVPVAYSHEPGLGQVSTKDGLDDDDGLLLRWVVFSRGDGA